MLFHVVNKLQVPLFSFGATDPTLSSLQYPYFLRTTINDHFQMYAIADLVQYFGWREVVAIFVDNDYGRNGISILDDALTKNRAKISYKAAFALGPSISDINILLVEVNLMELRVFLIATDWLPSLLDPSATNSPE
ncbi:unnamed protein product [Fraxinus pennsylvanica]|uniref:Receptor ligand binding region domain-containing protein n=1 Tax=Fraxinus pennsylvanica TaxID=56036 RepID=A0AAD2DVA8_9LAMI|nr:unnamed protein product [Fraxinus pennsylvanica]